MKETCRPGLSHLYLFPSPPRSYIRFLLRVGSLFGAVFPQRWYYRVRQGQAAQRQRCRPQGRVVPHLRHEVQRSVQGHRKECGDEQACCPLTPNVTTRSREVLSTQSAFLLFPSCPPPMVTAVSLYSSRPLFLSPLFNSFLFFVDLNKSDLP